MKRKSLKWTLVGAGYAVAIVATLVVTYLLTMDRTERYFFKQFDTLTQFRSSPGCALNRSVLGLSKADLDRVNWLCRTFNRDDREMRSTLRGQRTELASLLVQTAVDTVAVLKVTDSICALQAAMESSRVRHILSIREVLTPEQQARFRPFAREAVCHWLGD